MQVSSHSQPMTSSSARHNLQTSSELTTTAACSLIKPKGPSVQAPSQAQNGMMPASATTVRLLARHGLLALMGLPQAPRAEPPDPYQQRLVGMPLQVAILVSRSVLL